MKRPPAAVLLSLALPAAAALAEEKGVSAYTVGQCVRIGMERATVLANAERDEKIAKARYLQYRSIAMPQLAGSAGYTRLDEVSSFDLGDGNTIEMGKLDNYSAGVEASQLLFSGGKAMGAIEAGRIYQTYTRHATDRARQTLVRDIRAGFNDILLARASVDVEEESVRHLKEFVGQTRQKYENETASEFDLLSAKVRLANQEPQLILARNRYDTAREAFRNLILLDEEDYELAGELKAERFDGALPALVARAKTERPEIREMRSLVRLREQDVRVARSEYFPSLSAVAGYQGRNPDSNEIGSDDWGWHWSAGFVARWSFLDGGARRGRLLEKIQELSKLRANLDDLLRAVELDVRQAWLALRHSEEALAGSEENVRLAQKALEIARTRYDAGLATYLEYTESNLALSTARLTRYAALRAQMNAVLQLRYACGMEDPILEEEPQP